MMNKTIIIYCKLENKFKIDDVLKNGYVKDVVFVEVQDDIVRMSFQCSIFKVKNVQRDIEILNIAGIKTQMKVA